MKKLVAMTMVCAGLLVTPASAMYEGLYPHTAIVSEINTIDDGILPYTEVIVVDAAGRSWAFYDDQEDWFVGDLCSMIMFDNGTEIVHDDEVISARYAGTPDMFM